MTELWNITLQKKTANHRTTWAMASMAMDQIARGYMGFNGTFRVNHKSMDWLRKKISQPYSYQPISGFLFQHSDANLGKHGLIPTSSVSTCFNMSNLV
jgi:hypothetical protein